MEIVNNFDQKNAAEKVLSTFQVCQNISNFNQICTIATLRLEERLILEDGQSGLMQMECLVETSGLIFPKVET